MAAAACAAASGLAHAQAYPARAVTFVVGYSAGGAVDGLARLVGKRMSDKLGQGIVVENKPGASETLAGHQVAKAKPDGYTILVSTEAPITQSQFLYKSLTYNPDTELLPVSILVRVPVALAISPQFPADAFPAFLENIKSRKPGQEVKFGSAGIGGVTHLPAAMLATKAGFEWVHVPYKGSPPLLQDMLAGRVDAGFTGFSNVLPHHNSGKLRIIGVGAASRIKSVPNVPTFKELGLQEIGAEYVIMLSAPAGTPREVVNLLASTARSVLQDKDFQEKHLEPQGLEPIGSTAAEAASYVAADRGTQRERIKVSGARLD
ncbi:tripartite tricarboxylate transporter substrate binding protein [Ramlibacter tataouinensis]|uniref:Bug family tripartite tricarboxylate transporter substrate binding protein n=1 Tax=Ramlibacter tataouinensis TaxID=94132 RepID=UPI0022F3A54F|nr:tripartite tricarboxylate transporter substrate binding protein [Ramlibacter tataouinensis]WBY01076.1 tripartite tricarboxylate transporter substrate binding protein [Ramlibacter tataouinensis]